MASFYFVTTDKPKGRGRGRTVDLAAAVTKDHNIINNVQSKGCDAMDEKLFQQLSATKTQAISRNKAKQARAFEAIGHYDVVGAFERKRHYPDNPNCENNTAPFAVVDKKALQAANIGATQRPAPRRREVPSWAEPRPGGIFC